MPIKVHIYGDYDDKQINKAIKDLQSLKTQAVGGSGPMDALGGAMGKLAVAAGGLFALGQVKDFLVSSMQAAIEDEKSMTALSKAMDNVGLSSKNAEAEGLIKSMSMQYGVADDLLRGPYQKLVTVTRDNAKAQDLLTTALDLSAAGYGDLTSTSKALSAAANGNFTALQRLKVPIDQNIIKSKDFGAAVEALNKVVGGQASAAAQTYGGQLARVQVAADEAKESIGYGLLDAINSVSGAFGGTGSLTSGIASFGDSMGNVIRGIGVMAGAMAEWAAKLPGVNQGTGDFTDTLRNLASYMGPFSFVAGETVAMIESIGDMGKKSAAETEVLNRSVQASESLYAGYTATLDANAAAATRTAAAQEQWAIKLSDAERAAIKAHDAVVYATDALKAWQQAISQSGSMDKWKADLLEIENKFKGISKSMSDTDTAGLKNRDTVRTMASDMISAVEDWGNRYHKTVTERIERAASEGKKLRDGLISAGMKPADVDKFLGGIGVWNTQLKLIASGLSRGEAASAMRYAGQAVGYALGDGIVAGITARKGAAAAAASQVVTSATYAARRTGGIESPSKVWHEMGTQLGAGLENGIKESTPKLVVAASELMSLVSKAAADTLAKRTELVNAARDELKGALDTARQAVTDWQSSMTSTLTGGMGIEAAFSNAGSMSADALKKAWDTKFAEYEWFNNVLKALKAQGASPELIAQVSSQGQTIGGAWGQNMLDNGMVKYWTDNIAKVTQMGTDTATALTPTSLIAGQQMAEQTYAGFLAKFGPGGESFTALQTLMDWIAQESARQVRVDINVVRTVSEIVQQVAIGNIGKRAAGGPVSPGTWLVGEKGPELLSLGTSGYVTPNKAIGGANYNITVQAGVGDPRAIGQQVVEYIRRFEQSNGNVFAPAA